MTTDVVTEAPASFVQERMFTEEHLFDTRTIYTVGSGLRLSGTLDPERLRAAMSEVTRRHEILRTSFRLRTYDPDMRAGGLDDAYERFRRLVDREAATG